MGVLITAHSSGLLGTVWGNPDTSANKVTEIIGSLTLTLPTAMEFHNYGRRKPGTKADWAELAGSWQYVAIGGQEVDFNPNHERGAEARDERESSRTPSAVFTLDLGNTCAATFVSGIGSMLEDCHAAR